MFVFFRYLGLVCACERESEMSEVQTVVTLSVTF